MFLHQIVKAVLPGAAFFGIVVAGMLVNSHTGQAESNNSFDPSKVAKGLQIAPVQLKYAPQNRDLVGYGSWLVNAVADCNGCHTGGGPPNFNYANGFNPYFGQPAKVDPTVYLAGGAEFGMAGVGAAPYEGPVIVARNLTPDRTGQAEGGNTFEQFLQIIRHGTDLDKLHTTCTSVTPPTPANCIPGPVDGYLLQVMPWPVFNNLTDQDLLAIYTYLSAIPCIAGPSKPSDLPPEQQYAFKALHNDCGKGKD